MPDQRAVSQQVGSEAASEQSVMRRVGAAHSAFINPFVDIIGEYFKRPSRVKVDF